MFEIFSLSRTGEVLWITNYSVCVHIRCNIAVFILRDWRNPQIKMLWRLSWTAWIETRTSEVWSNSVTRYTPLHLDLICTNILKIFRMEFSQMPGVIFTWCLDNRRCAAMQYIGFSVATLTFRHRASCILGQAFHSSPENAFYIFNQQMYFIIWYLLDRASLI